VSNPH